MNGYYSPQDALNAAREASRAGRDPRKYGGYNAGANDDMARYQEMAQRAPQAAPVIDKARSNQTRRMTMGGLGMIEDRARGGWTPAQQLAQEQTRGAVYGLQSQAASIKGGAMARAAAARLAQQQTAAVAATGAQDQQALRAREMADAAGQYAQGTTGLRGADLGLANSQAGLDVGQRAQDDQREGFYEGLRFDTGAAATNAQLGKTAQDSSALAADMRAKQVADADSMAQGQRYASAAIGGTMGGISAYEASKRPRYGTGREDY